MKDLGRSSHNQGHKIPHASPVDLNNLPAALAARIRKVASNNEDDGEDDEVDTRVPSTWGVNHSSTAFRSATSTLPAAPSMSSGASTYKTARDYAPGFAPRKEKKNLFDSLDQSRGFSFSSVIPDVPQASSWGKTDPPAGAETEPSISADIYAQQNQALEGTFKSIAVTRVDDESSGYATPRANDEYAGGSEETVRDQDLDPRLEDQTLDIDPDVRANFVTVDQLHRVPLKRSALAVHNSSLIASNTSATISTVIAGETVTYTPKPRDKRVQNLDRYGKYIGEDLGQISKRLKRQHKEDIAERDRQMLQATAEYRALLAMSLEERLEVLERLRKPLIFHGAFEADQEDVEELPRECNRNMFTNRVMNWMEDTHDRPSEGHSSTAPSVTTTASRDNWSMSDGFIPINGFDDDDNFAAGQSSFPPMQLRPRTQKYYQDVLFYGRKLAPPVPKSQRSSSATSSGIASQLDRTQLSSSLAFPSSLATSQSSTPVDVLLLDDTPEFQIPADTDNICATPLTHAQQKLYRLAVRIAEKHGRVVQVRLHEPVHFSPGAIAQRVFGGTIQEIQVFPAQRIALVVFLHSREAKAFVRHVRNTHERGSAHEIRMLQVDVGWYGGRESMALLPPSPNLLHHHIATKLTRSLRLHRIPLETTKSELSERLGSSLKTLLLKVLLCTPAQRYLQLECGRQAIVEFASMKDALEAKGKLWAGQVYGFEGSEPGEFGDTCERRETEKGWCTCLGCRELKEVREAEEKKEKEIRREREARREAEVARKKEADKERKRQRRRERKRAAESEEYEEEYADEYEDEYEENDEKRV